MRQSLTCDLDIMYVVSSRVSLTLTGTNETREEKREEREKESEKKHKESKEDRSGLIMSNMFWSNTIDYQANLIITSITNWTHAELPTTSWTILPTSPGLGRSVIVEIWRYRTRTSSLSQ